jgi:hypothetical protein
VGNKANTYSRSIWVYNNNRANKIRWRIFTSSFIRNTTIIMHFENRHYVVFDLSEVDTIDFSEVMETSADTLRKNLANTQSFVKYESDMPASITALNTRSQEYTHAEILALLAGEEWTDPNAEI